MAFKKRKATFDIGKKDMSTDQVLDTCPLPDQLMLTINEKALEFPSERKTEGKINRNFPFVYSSLIFLIFLSLLPPNVTDLEEFSLNFYSSVTEVEKPNQNIAKAATLKYDSC